jgi:aspartokinase-like uncharacterized kinase
MLESACNTHGPLVVYKVGGSLLSLPDLAARIRRVLSQNPATRPVLIGGGGPAADLVRVWDRVHQLGEEGAHHMALAAMTLTAALLNRLLPASVVVPDAEAAAAAWAGARLPILNADAWLSTSGLSIADVLERTWDTTSDSIAAAVAIEWRARALVLLKSVERPSGDARDAAEHGAVDACFPRLAGRLPNVDWVNLRAPEPAIQPWLQSGRSRLSNNRL